MVGFSGPAEGFYTRAQFRRDAGAVFTWENLECASLGLGAAGVAHHWDGPVQRRVSGYRGAGSLLDLGNLYGSSAFELPASLGVWGLACLADAPELRAGAADVVRTLGFTQVVVGPLKRGVRRPRPDHSNRLSFPSGHAANAFAMAGVLTRRYGWRAGVPLYLAAPVVCLARLAGNHHYLSDVVAGAALGSIVGYSLPLTPGEPRLGWAPGRTAGGWELVLWLRL